MLFAGSAAARATLSGESWSARIQIVCIGG
jgi:hypothetical protein